MKKLFRISALLIILTFNNCQTAQIKLIKDTRNVENNPDLFLNSLNTINVKSKGAIGNGIDDDTQAIQLAASTGKILYFPSGKYKISKTINLKNSVYGKGEIIASQFIGFNVAADNISIKGITIESTLTNGKTAPFSVTIVNQENFEISNTTLINNRIHHLNRKFQHLQGLKISQNTFRSNFTPFLRGHVQNDVITVRGIDNVLINNNFLECQNVNRVVKIADIVNKEISHNEVSPYNSKNINIEDNIIKAVTDSNKQVIDLFNGCQNVTIRNNEIEAIGFNSVIENKTGVETSFAQNTVITNNTIKSNNSILSFQGSWGALTPNHHSGYQNILIKDNYFEGLSPFQKNDRGIIKIRFFHQVDIENNEIVFEKQANRMGASFYSNKTTTFNYNIIKNAGIQFTKAVSNHTAAPYDGEVEKINIKSNTIENGYFTNNHGSISIVNIGNSNSALNILQNIFSQSNTDKFQAIVLRKVKFDTINIKANNIANGFKKKVLGVVQISTNSSKVYNESLNSWN